MNLRFGPLLVLVMTLSTVTAAEKFIVAYVPNWIDLKSFVRTIDYDRLTHLNIAFENPTNRAGDLSFNSKNTALLDEARKHGVKVLISIGGGAASTDRKLMERYFELLAEDRRADFATKLAEYVVAHGFDGLDVDIEGPSINSDYGAFIHELAKAFRPRRKLLTAALSKGYGGGKVPDSALAQFDFVNIMAYDGAGPWNPKAPGQHSSFEFATNNVAYWLKRGLPKARAVLGVPFYGYGFGDAFRKNSYGYANILAAHPGAENSDQAGNRIWYNGLPTIRAKSQYVVDHGLAGVMIWSLEDDVKGERSLLRAIHETLHPKREASPSAPVR